MNKQHLAELKYLRAENEQLHQTNVELHMLNLELNMRQTEMILENDQVWKFVMAAKRFRDNLIQDGYKSDSRGDDREWLWFRSGFETLAGWLRRRQKELEPKNLTTETKQPTA